MKTLFAPHAAAIVAVLAGVALLILSASIPTAGARVGKFIFEKTASAPLALFFNRNDAKFALAIGNYYFNVGRSGAYDLVKAERYFQKAIKIDPGVPDAWHQLARIDFLRGDFAGALMKINKQIELHGDSFMASYYIRGLINGYAGNFDDAEKDFLKFLAWDKNNWAASNDLAWIYFEMGKYQKVEEVATRALTWNSENVWLLTSLGVSLLNQKKYEEARVALARARENIGYLTEADWSKAYPGNDPDVARAGLENMKKTIEENLALASMPK